MLLHPPPESHAHFNFPMTNPKFVDNYNLLYLQSLYDAMLFSCQETIPIKLYI